MQSLFGPFLRPWERDALFAAQESIWRVELASKSIHKLVRHYIQVQLRSDIWSTVPKLQTSNPACCERDTNSHEVIFILSCKMFHPPTVTIDQCNALRSMMSLLKVHLLSRPKRFHKRGELIYLNVCPAQISWKWNLAMLKMATSLPYFESMGAKEELAPILRSTEQIGHSCL